jgi:AcrR family transcriptional regulator
VARTERALRDALVSLVHEKHYDSIVVREILERADVGRSAFYAHFRDKRDLLENGIQHMLQATPSSHQPRIPKRFEKALGFSARVFDYVGRHRHGDVKMGRRARVVLHDHLKESLVRRIADDVHACVLGGTAGPSGVPASVLVEYIVTTFILVLNWWVDSKSTLSAREVDDVFMSLVVPALQAATGDE